MIKSNIRRKVWYKHSTLAREQAQLGVQQACDENLIGFERTYRLTFYFALAALIISLFMPGRPFTWAGRTAAEAFSPAMD